MFDKILIANRGEIAVRIIRACKELGIKTVAIYSEADADSLHVAYADEAICVGPAKSQNSYLNIPNILNAALISGAKAIHPGFGYFSENPTFAEACEACGLEFIGPKASVIELMGDKAEAKKTAKRAGCPVVPGGDGLLKDENEALALANEMGYPVRLKATAGGGGRGIRIVNDSSEISNAYRVASAEAEAAFGNGALYIEKDIQEPRHIEIQILGDKFGNYVHLGERECSIQRRNQKLLEEAPSCAINAETREKMGKAAIALAKEVGYYSVGTIEFLLDKNNDFYFMEMNTRVQVEHPVSEYVSDVDIVKEQIRIAFGEKLSVTQDDIDIKGHAIECRIIAEDPDNNFAPSAGVIKNLVLPGGPGVRVDTHIYDGYEVPPYYDAMICKVIVYAKNRQEAIIRMKRALSEMHIDGIKTNIEYQFKILENPYFEKGEITTGFIPGRMNND
ncbi:MAG: acetyl-CoA carboxylase biotin carboxylase subunit [Armatimonadetes bacterium]|nr:acetyl-CoA carboxylase biotin carboxylase subunit [Candidatus Hippobium faecium]